MKIVLFEDDQVRQLYPVCLGRPAFAVTCGGQRLIDVATRLSDDIACVVRPHLREIHLADFPAHAATPDRRAGHLRLLLNARLVPSESVLARLRELVKHERPCQVRTGGCVVAVVLGQQHSLPVMDLTHEALSLPLDELDLPSVEIDLPLLDYPHDIIRHHLRTMGENLAARLATGQYEERADGLFVAAGAEIGPYVVTDTARGPIVVEAGAKIGPYCYISGPVLVGPGARVIEHAALKDSVTLGHTTKIGGEIEASIVEAYTNKQHHGFLGHSYLGSWINLGAGTCNSDLKNTYGTVNMEYHGRKVPTEMQFIGAMIGDYAKTAINTAIFTGKTIGACSMVYGFVTTNVPSFVNYARSFGQVSETPVDVMIATQARMFMRRNVQQRPCDIQLLRDMYELTRHERQLGGDPLQL